MLSRVTLDRSSFVVDRESEGGWDYPTINVISAEGINYLTLAPGFKEGKVSLALKSPSADGTSIIYYIEAPHSNLIYYSGASIIYLLDSLFYNNTGLSIDQIGLTYHDKISNLKMFGEYSLQETLNDFVFTHKLQDLRLLQ